MGSRLRGGDEEFAAGAVRLAGLAGALLGWRPAEFWRATPAELAAVLTALAGEAESAPADAATIDALRRCFRMDDIDELVVRVRADTGAFASDVASMRSTLETGFGSGVDRASRAIETGLARAIRSGKLGFDDLKRIALAALADIAAAAITKGIGAVLGGESSGGGGLLGIGTQLLGGLLGLPGRATGGPVAPGAAYVVGERGPELFVPTASGRIEAARGGGRDVRVAITVNAGGDAAPAALERSGRQVARAVRRALLAAER